MDYGARVRLRTIPLDDEVKAAIKDGCLRTADSGEGEHHSGGKPNTNPVIANTIGAKRRWQLDCA
jgi:hypothetical protein